MTAIAALVSAVCGAAIGILFTVAHRATMPIGDLAFPYGIVLGVVSAVAFLAAMRLLWDTRWPAVGGAIGLFAAIVVLSFGGPGGSVVVTADGFGWTWLILPTVAAAIAVAWPKTPLGVLRRRRAESVGDGTIEVPEEPAEER